MAKVKITHTCQHCGATYSKWAGQCSNCGSWNSLVEEIQQTASRYQGYAIGEPEVTQMTAVSLDEQARIPSGLSELRRAGAGCLLWLT